MEEIAERIVAAIEPSEGWWRGDTQEVLEDVAVTMLEDMDEDTVEECLHRIVSQVREEYGE